MATGLNLNYLPRGGN